MSELDDVLEGVRVANAAGMRVALASVVAVKGSAYRRPGARMLVTEDRETIGGVSGGCLESDVILRAVAAIRDGNATLASYDTARDDDIDFGVGVGCSGVVRVLIEPLPCSGVPRYLCVIGELRRANKHAALATVWQAGAGGPGPTGGRLLHDGRDVCWTDIGNPMLLRAIADDATRALAVRRSLARSYRMPNGEFDVLVEYMPSRVPLLIFGGGPDAVPLVLLGKALGWNVTVVDARESAANRERFPTADAVVHCRPEDVRKAVPLGDRSTAVVMTHHYRRDLVLLKELLPLPFVYLGLLGPRTRAARLLDELRKEGFTATVEQLARLHAPAGLDLGAESPEEIALSIAAEVTAVLSGRAATHLRDRKGPIHDVLETTT